MTQRQNTNRRFTAIIERDDEVFVALCPELDIASQGASIVEAKSNLQEAIELFFETASDDEIDERMTNEIYITNLEVGIG